jgi:FKBP-type peptidyl-prolyl cis-trans isomerase SlyD
MTMTKIESNAFVLLDYTLRDDKGDILDESIGEGGEPISYVHGYGMLVPGLEAGLSGLAPGDEFVAESPDGDEVVMRVVELTDEGVIVDANHPLAGLTLHYQVRVREVRKATDDEIAQAAANLEEAEAHGHVHGPDCDHDHDHETGNLVTLGKKKPEPGKPN